MARLPMLATAVVLPMYNEADNVATLLDRLDRVRESSGLELIAVAVDDGSRDATAARLSELAPRYAFLRIVRHARNHGMAAALRTGIAAALAEPCARPTEPPPVRMQRRDVCASQDALVLAADDRLRAPTADLSPRDQESLLTTRAAAPLPPGVEPPPPSPTGNLPRSTSRRPSPAADLAVPPAAGTRALARAQGVPHACADVAGQDCSSQPPRQGGRVASGADAAAPREGVALGVDDLPRCVDILAFMDADLTHAPEDLPRLIAPIAEDRADFVLGSRYVPGGRMQGVPWARAVISIVGNAAVRRLLGVPVADLTSGFRAARAEVFRAIALHENGFGIQLEGTVNAYRAGFRLAEVPITLGVRKSGYSKMAYTRSFWLAYARLTVRLWLDQSRSGRAGTPHVVDSLARTRYAEVEDPQGRRSAV